MYPFPHQLHCLIVQFFQRFFGNVHIGKQALEFGEGYVPNCLKFHTGRQGALIYQVQSSRIFVVDVFYLFLPFTCNIELMTEVGVSFMSFVDTNLAASY